ncbi:MAG TPA: response regulator [Opitutaceae bacterium]|nr:response regulator [Opitutaceae bacterium]
MRYKILTVDDSKTVRVIVRRAFRSFDCEVFEANNGEEGLAVATKELPHLILLDITMPVMDGVEMLTRLKAAPALKAIPVIMLTAEGGRDNVLKIAKIGVRDYLIKPFKESVLIAKVARVLDLQPTKPQSISDPAQILVIEDQPEVVQEIQDGLKHLPWKINRVATLAEATASCTQTVPDIVVASLSLANHTAYTFLREVRVSPKLKTTPVFALTHKGDIQFQKAVTAGFNAIVTKPLDFADLELKFARAMHLDMSHRYFSIDGDAVTLVVPENSSQVELDEIATCLPPKLTQAKAGGCTKLLIDVHEPKGLNIAMIKVILQAMKAGQEMGIPFAIIGNEQIVNDCRTFEDTRDWTIFETADRARRAFGVSADHPTQLTAS